VAKPLNWNKSSFTGANGDCVEAATTWRKSSFTGGEGDCVEAATDTHVVYVRDSKAPGDGTLAFPDPAWRGLLASVTK
jgi:hypothetical protein